MVHYTLLKLTKDADVTSIFFRCRKVYAEMELALPFLHDTQVCRAETTRGSNADIMIIAHLDGPEYISDYLQDPRLQAFMAETRDYVMEAVSFDEKEAC